MNSQADRPVLLEEMTWKDTERMIANGMRTVIWPIGAVEAHGFHLPVVTDTLCVSVVAHRVSALTGIPVLPVQAIGVSLGHSRFPGTLALRPQTLMRVTREIVDSLYSWGIRQILLLNGHMWNEGTLLAVREELRADYDDLQVKVVSYWKFGDTSKYDNCPEAPAMSHAEFKETSWVLAERPDLVQMNVAVNEPDFLQFWDYRMDQVSSSGVMGRATTNATAEAGREMIEVTARALADELNAALHEKIPIPDWKTVETDMWGPGRASVS